MAKKGKKIEVEYLSVDEAETMTGRSHWSWRKDAYSGRITSAKVGRRLFIPMTEVRRVMDEALRPRMEQQKW